MGSYIYLAFQQCLMISNIVFIWSEVKKIGNFRLDQDGRTSPHSTKMTLLAVNDHIIKATSQITGYWPCVFFDLSSAFDNINHSVLLASALSLFLNIPAFQLNQ